MVVTVGTHVSSGGYQIDSWLIESDKSLKGRSGIPDSLAKWPSLPCKNTREQKVLLQFIHLRAPAKGRFFLYITFMIPTSSIEVTDFKFDCYWHQLHRDSSYGRYDKFVYFYFYTNIVLGGVFAEAMVFLPKSSRDILKTSPYSKRDLLPWPSSNSIDTTLP